MATSSSSSLSSRLIVKNLPKDITKDKLKEHFSKLGEVTDVRMVHTRTGKFRRFCFIGYPNESIANEAVRYFNRTYIGSTKIEVSLARMYGDTSIPRPWSKYSKGSSAFGKLNPSQGEITQKEDTKIANTRKEGKKDLQRSGHRSELASLLGEYYELESDPGFREFLEVNQKRGCGQKAWSNDEKTSQSIQEEPTKNEIKSDEISDLDYLKSKVVTNLSNEVESSTLPSSPVVLYTLRMRGLPFKCNESDIRSFFNPLQLAAVRLLLDDNNRSTGLAFVDFTSEKDREVALSKNKEKIGTRYIELFIDDGEQKKRPWEGKEEEGVESINESGRIFVRNLSYTTTEDELTKLFEVFGELTEMSLLVNKETGSSIGLAYVTFMFPEHAVRAFSELDGQIFQGRLLHLLPSKPPTNSKASLGTTTKVGGSSYKTKRDEKLKSQATNPHNWNTLFLGSNAVVDAMVDQYDITKSQLLDVNTDQSLAVRLALGETQLVSDTKEFLESHGVQLELFDDEAIKRSKTVILVKNLPFGTTSQELHDLFSVYGSISRLVLPPAGVSALIEYTSSSEAKRAFKKLAYTEFKHLPLYLEWAPFGIMSNNESESTRNESESTASQATLFVKNLNFSTTDDDLLAHFKKGGERSDRIVSAVVSRSYNPTAGSLSRGYGFVTFSTLNDAKSALKEKQSTELDGHKLELSLSQSTTQSSTRNNNPKMKRKVKQLSENKTKILIRNIPFEASQKELRQLFKPFGELKSVRLPKKLSSSHRGFGFIEYVSSEDAVNAFESLSSSTHLYGRRLVLEWAMTEESVDTLRAKVSRYYGEEPVAKRRKKLADDLLKVEETVIE